MQESSAKTADRPTEERELERAFVERESARQGSARWPAGFEHCASRPYQICSATVMDTTDPEITFDEQGVSNWVPGFRRAEAGLVPSAQRPEALRKTVEAIRAAGQGKPYDCVVGLSGGVDSSYVALLVKEQGLRPLIVHFDNGWNSELAVQNIENIVRKLELDLQTFVMDWPEFRDLQRSYFKASVLDLEVPTDHMILGAVYKIAAQHGIRYVVSGANIQTEWVLPKAWYYPKQDLVNLKGIHRAYGTRPLKNLPALGLAEAVWYDQAKGISFSSILDLIDYDKPTIKRRLIDELEWRDYGGKHHESIFTRFYQGYILPRKFNVDKRKAHLSNLILAGQISRAQALTELLEPPYNEDTQREDFTFVAKKLGFSEQELHDVLTQPNRSHLEFGTDRRYRALYQKALQRLQPVKSVIRPIARAVRGVVR